jgi:sialate O-acetylesterase
MNQELRLELGPIDDMDITYFNGARVGSYEADGQWRIKRIYKIPANLVQEKENIIAIRVIDSQGGGGIYGKPENMRIYPAADSNQIVDISGEWKYLPLAELRGIKFYIYDTGARSFAFRPEVKIDRGANVPTVLFNAMVNPVVPYGIRGAIWYQGEANTGNPKQNARLLPDLISAWRAVWGQGDFPFYYVQIAPYDYGANVRSQDLREAQFQTLKVPGTGMAVTLDIGNPQNIHPANKRDVGERLALWALAKDYGSKIEFSGPLYKSMKVKNDKIILSFDHRSRLIFKNLKPGHFIIAGKDKVFKPAQARIEAGKVVVSNPEIKDPAAVRYLWDNTSEASLFNSAGLPASSFRTDNWDE